MLYPIQNEVRNRLDLSGIWDFRTDPDEIGAGAGWFNGLPDARPIAVPGSWNDQYADLYPYPGMAWYPYPGMAWYARAAFVPRSWQG